MDHDLIIVGGGVAGSAAALRAAQNGLHTLWIRGTRRDHKRSRGHWVVNIDNMIGVHEGIIRGKVQRVLARGEAFAHARDALAAQGHMTISTRDVIGNVVDRIEADYPELVTMLEETATAAARTPDGDFEVSVGEERHRATGLLLATGVMDRQPSILKDHRGSSTDDIKWIYPAANREQVLYCIRCEGHLTRTRAACVVGHGEAAASIAMMLHERYGSAETVLTNGEAPTWSERAGAILAAYGIQVRTERIVDLGSERAALRSITLEGAETLEVAFALVSLGLYRVYNDLARDLGADLADEGRPEEVRHVRIDSRGETTVTGLFAVGDMTSRDDEPVMKQVYTCQEYAVRAVDELDRRRRDRMRSAALAAHAET